MRRAARIDTTQRPIVQYLRGAGCEVEIINGVIDLLVYQPSRARLAVVDCKTGAKAKLTDKQQQLLDRGWPLVILPSVDAAIAWVKG